MTEVSDKVYKKAVKLAPRLYEIWFGDGHMPEWDDLRHGQQETAIRCAEQTILAIAPDVWDEGKHDGSVILPVDPPRKLPNPYR